MDIKKKEFLDLKQKNKTVMEYTWEFNKLSRCAPGEIDSDSKKQEWFMNGLTTNMQDKMSALKFANFNDLVSSAITVEHKWKAYQEEKKRKRVLSPSVGGTSQQRPRTGLPPPPWVPNSTLPQPMWLVRHAALTSPRPVGAPSGGVRRPCYNYCNPVGHLSRNCPYPLKNVEPNAPRPLPPPPLQQEAKSALKHGRANHGRSGGHRCVVG